MGAAAVTGAVTVCGGRGTERGETSLVVVACVRTILRQGMMAGGGRGECALLITRTAAAAMQALHSATVQTPMTEHAPPHPSTHNTPLLLNS